MILNIFCEHVDKIEMFETKVTTHWPQKDRFSAPAMDDFFVRSAFVGLVDVTGDWPTTPRILQNFQFGPNNC